MQNFCDLTCTCMCTIHIDAVSLYVSPGGANDLGKAPRLLRRGDEEKNHSCILAELIYIYMYSYITLKP